VSGRWVWLALGALLACGKYGPPVRASEAAAKKPAQKPSLEVPLPSVMQPEPAAPTPTPEPEPEREPPPEGSP
jgi:hypothetical protein